MKPQSEQPALIEKIAGHFKTQIGVAEFAQQIRRANHILAGVMMEPDAEQNIVKSHWARDCFYHLNEFAELIDPFLEKE